VLLCSSGEEVHRAEPVRKSPKVLESAEEEHIQDSRDSIAGDNCVRRETPPLDNIVEERRSLAPKLRLAVAGRSQWNLSFSERPVQNIQDPTTSLGCQQHLAQRESRNRSLATKCRKIKTALDYRDGGSDLCVLLTGQGPLGMHYDALVLRQVASAPASRGKRSKAVREAQNSHSADFRGAECVLRPKSALSLPVASISSSLFFVDVCKPTSIGCGKSRIPLPH
jgi:hypothetical protein